MKFLIICLITLALASNVFAQTKNWKISDYLKNLPEKYKTFGADGIDDKVRRVEIIDNKNGYVAYQNADSEEGYEPLVFFEMAKFNPRRGYPTIVVNNYVNDHVCSKYDSYFLQKRGNRWVNVKSSVLPKLNISMFFIGGKSGEYYKYYERIQKKYKDKISSLEYRFHPPRKGTKMKITVETCDWIDDSVTEDLEDYYMAVGDSIKPIYLQWNKSKGKFEIVKENLD